MVANFKVANIWPLLIVAIKIATAQDTHSFSHQNENIFDAIVELQARNTILSARVDAAESTNSKLQQRINELESKCLESTHMFK